MFKQGQQLRKLLICFNRMEMETYDDGSYCFVFIEWRHAIMEITDLF